MIVGSLCVASGSCMYCTRPSGDSAYLQHLNVCVEFENGWETWATSPNQIKSNENGMRVTATRRTSVISLAILRILHCAIVYIESNLPSCVFLFFRIHLLSQAIEIVIVNKRDRKPFGNRIQTKHEMVLHTWLRNDYAICIFINRLQYATRGARR